VLQLLFVKLVRIEGVEADVVVNELSTDLSHMRCKVNSWILEGTGYTRLALEVVPLFDGQRVTLSNDGDNVHNLGEFLHHDDIDGAQRVAGWVDEEESAVDAGIDNVLVTHRRQLLAKVSRVLILSKRREHCENRTEHK
jgi:hypothetical protein